MGPVAQSPGGPAMAQSSRRVYWSAILADFRRSGMTDVPICPPAASPSAPSAPGSTASAPGSPIVARAPAARPRQPPSPTSLG